MSAPTQESRPDDDGAALSRLHSTGDSPQSNGAARNPANTAYDGMLDALRDGGSTVTERRDGHAMAQCPAHDDRKASLSVSRRRDGRGVVVHCHAGCPVTDIVAVVDLTMADLFDDDGLRAAWAPSRDYQYRGGRRVHRKPDKTFRQSGNTADRSLYHADRIGDATTVYVVEGEKDVEVVEAVGGTAVCSPMGAGKADKVDWSDLAGKNVTIVADKDNPGRKHAADIAARLKGVATCVRVVEAKQGKDVADHIAAGYTLDELIADTGSSEGTPKLWRATDLKAAAQPRWLAKHRLPRAAVTLLIGDEGLGKSLLWVWIGAAVTTGKPLPEFGIPAREPALVFVVVTEDGWQDTVLPRLEVAGADLDMVRVICTESDGSGSPIFPRDLFLITDADQAPALIVVDAWLDTVTARLSVRDPQQARQALHPFKEIATITDAAVLLLCHTNRVDTANARDRYGATGELRKKARMTLYAQTDEDDNLVVGPEKMNTARPIPASVFTITSVQHFDPTEDHDGTVPLLSYLGESELTAREQLAENYAAANTSSDGSDALVWLAAELAAGPRWVSDIYTAGELAGYSKDRLKRAKLSLHAESQRDGDANAWYWRMAHHQGSTPPPYVAPLLPCSLALQGQNQGSASTSQESKRVNAETRAPLRSLASGDEQGSTGLGPQQFCPGCGTYWVANGHHRADCTASANHEEANR
jgi:5S rRNA maturation endonuclease (ribonuclease M5)